MTTLPIENHDSRPTVPLSEPQKVRFGDLARDLEQARIQGHVEAGVLAQMLDLVRTFLPALLR